MTARVLIPIADGSEEIEAVTLIDVLRRAGAEVTVASVADGDRLTVVASRDTRITADTHIDVCADSGWDLVVLPGGLRGAEHLRDNARHRAGIRVGAGRSAVRTTKARRGRGTDGSRR